ncbi:hypothetical protein ILYODFUR_016440 [Ilyodon furcidens]|uniref:Uncharacterized protein n=1 Tax=Ilyodon furcidens TaxID=33524 RepID=A0ABV0VEH5_9TELE
MNTVPTVKHGGGSIMLRLFTAARGVCALHKVSSIMMIEFMNYVKSLVHTNFHAFHADECLQTSDQNCTYTIMELLSELAFQTHGNNSLFEAVCITLTLQIKDFSDSGTKSLF